MRIGANAKINLTLDITGKREDGYHLIDSVFQAVGVFDTVNVEKSDGISVLCEGISDENNIAWTAAEKFFCRTGIKGGAKIEIEKHIPLLSGLGGGSSDAAAVITALNAIYETKLNLNELAEIGLECGADVPFFFYGGTARVGGIGEKVTPLAPLKGYYILIVKSGDKRSTADMYKKLDGMPGKTPVTPEFTELLRAGRQEEALSISSNAFSAVAGDKKTLESLSSFDPLAVSISGSGPSHFAIFKSKTAAIGAAESISGEYPDIIVAPFV
ncbi:MAG: 4-(cytidine 5'-diphospho)-2-C-methyl-D-erythritol kinase [Clostridia bacterium]|nr:4-(cytidine 5'-diphospho)-2-C-methyl-D-erythritol kinase [Clostridia bacterium]